MGLGYLIPVMWSCLSLAALIGAVFTGFWLSSANTRKREALKKSLDAKLRQSEQDSNTTIARLTSELEKHRAQIPTLEDSLAARSTLIAAQEKDLDDAAQQLKLAGQKLCDERQRTKAGDRLVATLQHTASALERDRADFENQISTLSQEKGRLESAHSRIAAELEKSREKARQMAQKAEEYYQRTQEYDQGKVAQREIERQLEAMRSSCDELGEQLLAKDVELSELRNELQVSAVETDNLRQAHAKQLQMSNTEMADLQSKFDTRLTESETLRRSLAEELAARDAQISDMESVLDAKRTESVQLHEHLAKQQLSHGNLTAKQEQTAKNLSESTAHCTRLEELQQEIRSELHRANDRIQQLEVGVEKARRQYEEERENRRHWQGRCQLLESDLASVNTVEVADNRQDQDRDSDNRTSDRLAALRCENNKLARALKRTQRDLRKQAHQRAPHQEPQSHPVGDKNRGNLLTTGASLPFSHRSPRGPSRRLAAMLSTATDERDDLQKIRGIGPVMVRTLNELGIYRFQQLAALGTEDIAWIASNINTFPGRIERDQWVAQAAALGREKDGS